MQKYKLNKEGPVSLSFIALSSFKYLEYNFEVKQLKNKNPISEFKFFLLRCIFVPFSRHLNWDIYFHIA